MTFSEFREYCLSKPGATEDFPFDEKVLVFRVGNKMFALTDADDFESINLKSKPEDAVEQRERYAGVIPGYHMSKRHWNTVAIKSDVPDSIIYQLIDESYGLVIASLPKSVRWF